MFRLSTFDKNLENATSHLRLEPDWPSILLICDAIRQNDVSAKQAFQSIKKKMMSPNPHTAYYALLILESVVKNCGTPMHEEISTKENCEMFSTFIEQTPHENVKQKMLELIQTWAYAFRSSEKYQAIKDTMTILKAKGHNFPELVEADAMFTADTAPDWADGKVCHRCRVEFSFTQRKHHCRNCGQIFCAQCSSKQCPLPKYGIEKEVRVCDGCFLQLQKPTAGGVGAKPRPVSGAAAENELPAEYLSSSLAQQSQSPPKKTEQELKEEEELQLALALSQSEAEQQKSKPPSSQLTNYRIMQRSPSPEAPPAPAPAPAPAPLQIQTNPVSAPLPIEDTPSDPELAKYLNRSYWEQRKQTESPLPASPSAPSPMPQINNVMINYSKTMPDDAEIDDFSQNMKTQVEIFVNRMKSNSSRGRNISNDSSVQTLFMNLTSLHSRLLMYIKDMDDKRMWYEQLQDKLAQVRDSRAALDVLRQEHIDKLRRIAEEQERQRQLQMAHKLEIMRKKKQEYLQYQRQLALQRIQEQEREMQIRQEQQKAQYRMGQNAFGFMPPPSPLPNQQQQQGSPSHHQNMPPAYGSFGYNPNIQGGVGGGPPPQLQQQQQQQPRFIPQSHQVIQPPQTQPGGMPTLGGGAGVVPMPGMYSSGIAPVSNHQPNNMSNVIMGGGQMQNLPPQNAIQQHPSTQQGNMQQMQQIPNTQSQPTSQINQNQISGPGMISTHQSPPPPGQNVMNSGIPGVPTGAVVPGGQNFVITSNQQGPNQNMPQPQQQGGGMPPAMVQHNSQQPISLPTGMMPPNTVATGVLPPPTTGQSILQQQHPLPPAGQINVTAPAPVPHIEQNSNNQNSNQNHGTDASAAAVIGVKQSTEDETKEVTTAELISFD